MSTTTTPKYWLSPPPDFCDICGRPITKVFTDGKTSGGPWGIICPKCHPSYGMGHGLGRGQQYTKQPDGKFLKTKG